MLQRNLNLNLTLTVRGLIVPAHFSGGYFSMEKGPGYSNSGFKKETKGSHGPP